MSALLKGAPDGLEEQLAASFEKTELPAEFTQPVFTVKVEIRLNSPIGGVTITRTSLEKSYPRDATINP